MQDTFKEEWAAPTLAIFLLYTLILGLIPAKPDTFYATTRVVLYTQKSIPATGDSGGISGEISYEIKSEKLEARTAALIEFLRKRNSPLAPESQTFIEVADKYSLNWKLLPAIACKESGCGKTVPWNTLKNRPSYNPFGWGVHADSVIYFESWDQAIEEVGRNIKANYYDKGLTTPEQIETVYTPSSPAKGHPWSLGVSVLMTEISID